MKTNKPFKLYVGAGAGAGSFGTDMLCTWCMVIFACEINEQTNKPSQIASI